MGIEHENNTLIKDDKNDSQTIVGHLFEAVLENVFVEVIFNAHREITLNELVGLNVVLDGGIDDSNKQENSIVESLRNKNIECKCFVCNRMIAAVRFAPHLEKCIGIGRTARTRRRVNNIAIHNQNYATGRTTRSSTLRSAAKIDNNNIDTLNLIEHANAATEGCLNNADLKDQNLMRDRLRNKVDINAINASSKLTALRNNKK